MAQERRFWRGTQKISHVGRTGTRDSPPFLIQDGHSVAMITMPAVARCEIKVTQSDYKEVAMYAHFLCRADSLTWDDVCQLWDNGVYTAEDVKSIAPLFFDNAELSAVLDVIESVENESQALEAMNADPWYYEIQPAAINIAIKIFEYAEFESLRVLLERDRPRRGLH
jgi:hypothetical protein